MCGVMRCGIWCGVKRAVMCMGVVWNSCGCGMVLCDVEYVVLRDVVA